MYLFVHFICFYSNIFGFETKVTSKFQCYVASCNSTLQYQSCFAVSNEFMLQKIIPFYEVTAVRRAKTAGIFPNAIEIFAAGKKVLLPLPFVLYWFLSEMSYKFLSSILLAYLQISLTAAKSKPTYWSGSTSLHHFCPGMKHSSSLLMDGYSMAVVP